MKWVKASDRFPDDWEEKHWRYSYNHLKIDTSLFEHKENCLHPIDCSSLSLEYYEIEWLDEEPEQEQPKESLKEGSPYYQLFKFFSDEHSLTLTDGEIQDILYAVGQFNKSQEQESDKVDILQELGEKEIMIETFSKIRELFKKRTWIMEGRGPYPYNDDRYKTEVRCLFNEFESLESDLWKNIKTKTVDYRNKIISECQRQQPHNKTIEAAIEIVHEQLTLGHPEFIIPNLKKLQPQPNRLDACRFLNWSNDFEWRFEYRSGLGAGWVNNKKITRKPLTTEELYNGPYQEYLKTLNKKNEE